jgi:phosphohistidine phosphatase
VELYLIRHAEALALGERGITNDEERPLTEKGETQAVQLAKVFQKRGIVLDKLLTSPLVRTVQTAEIMLKVWENPKLALEHCPELAPGAKLRKLSKTLLKSGGEKIGLVGHMPQLGDFAAWMLGYKKAQIEFAKGGAALIECGDLPCKGHGALEWLVTPEWC